MEKRMIISPSILAANKQKLVEEVRLIASLGADYVHFDVMDGNFVPATSYNVKDFLLIKDHHRLVNDVHIMVSDPMKEGPIYAKSGADIVTFHIEALPNKDDILKLINKLHKLNCKAGISIKPCTKCEDLFSYLPYLDLVLVMSVEPGKGGQKFMNEALDKIKILRTYIDEHKLPTLIEVDGGINEETGKLCKEAGVDILVAGSYLFGHDDIKERIEGLR